MSTNHFGADPDRVRRQTDPEILQAIEQDIERRIQFYATQPAGVITQRIEQLDHEWDMERTLGTNASTLALSGALLGIVSSRKWFLLPCIVTGFLMQHAISGWCPPMPVFRRMGVRTRSEIDREKFALKILRGDFRNLPLPKAPTTGEPARQVLQTVNA